MEHHSNLLQGLNQLREKGQLLDVTLWAENRPFQVGPSLLTYYYGFFDMLLFISFSDVINSHHVRMFLNLKYLQHNKWIIPN
jgi:hypothetical protein